MFMLRYFTCLDRTADNQFNFGPSILVGAIGTTSFFLRNTNKYKPFLRSYFAKLN